MVAIVSLCKDVVEQSKIQSKQIIKEQKYCNSEFPYKKTLKTTKAASMHHKNKKLIVRKQLKNQSPNWKRFPQKNKKELARKILAEVVAEYQFMSCFLG